MINFLLVFLGIVASALAQLMLKKSGSFQFLKEPRFFFYLVFGGVFYAISFILYAYLLKIFSLSKISPVMTIGTMLLVVFAGMFFFKESIVLKQVVGIILGIISIILIVK